MSDVYAVTLRIEVLREFASSINASYSRYFIKHDIDRKNRAHPLVINNREVVAAKDNLLRCETLEELQPFENRLKELRDIIIKLEDEEQCNKKSWRSSPRVSLARR
jgi:hypothetical protein